MNYSIYQYLLLSCCLHSVNMGPKQDKKAAKAAAENDFEVDLEEDSNVMKLLKFFERSTEKLLNRITGNFEKLVEKLITKTEQCFNVKLDKQGADIFNNAKKCEELEKVNKELRKDFERMEQKIGVLISNQEKHKEELDEVESYSRRDCLIFSNLKPIEGQTDEQVFLKFCDEYFHDLNVSTSWVDKLHRLKSKFDTQANNQVQVSSDKPDRMIVKFSRGMYRDSIWQNKSKLKNSNIVITEQLTKWRGQLLKKCINDIKKDKWVFTNNCNVLVRFEGDSVPIHIRNESDILRLAEQ